MARVTRTGLAVRLLIAVVSVAAFCIGLRLGRLPEPPQAEFRS